MAEFASLIRIGGFGSLGVTLPKGELDKRGNVADDFAVLLPSDESDTFTRHYPFGE